MQEHSLPEADPVRKSTGPAGPTVGDVSRRPYPRPGPIAGAPDRVPGSVRRTTSLDLSRPLGPDGPIEVRGRGRDARTTTTGDLEILATALVSLTVSEERVTRLQAHPSPAGLSRLLGRRAVVGWRTGLWRELPSEKDSGSALHLLLDDLPGGMIIGGFTGRAARLEASATLTEPGRRLNVCAGWAAESRAALEMATTGLPPAPQTEPAPALTPADDPYAWHTLPALARWGISRRRRLDVLDTGAEILVDTMFRDSFSDGTGAERVLHEYHLTALLDRDTFVVREISAQPRVLPHGECPLAAGSVQALRGVPAPQLREQVSAELFGPASCTHLNDLARSVTDAPALVRART